MRKIHPFFAWVIILGLLVGWWTQGWFGDVLPLSPREENIPELSYIWSLYYAAQQGVLFSSWNPLFMAGSVNLIQRGYLVFAPIAYFSYILNLSPDVLYKILVAIIFMASGLGMCFYIKQLGLNSLSVLLGGFVYMFAPPHLAIGIEGFDFNLYWALIPWIMLAVEKYIQEGNLFQNSLILAVLLNLALLAGNTYFASTMPLFAIYILLRLILTKSKKIILFLSLSFLFFLTFSAFFTLPSIFEAKYSWISQVTKRKLIVNLPSLTQLISLFPKRIKGDSVLAFSFGGNFTDMSWYLGLSPILLAIVALAKKRYQWHLTTSLLFLLVVLFPFYSLTLPPFKTLALLLLAKIPRLQAVYDHTFRLFLPIVFSLSILASLGADTLSKKFHHPWRLYTIIALFCLIILEFQPFRSFFRSVPMTEIKKKEPLLQQLNQSPRKGRYWSPFSYVWHLPKYRLEYFTHYITRPRLNSQFLYIPYSPRYSSEVFEVLLTGALETQNQSIDFVATMLDWGNVDYIVLHPEVADYTDRLEELKAYSFNIINQTEEIIILEKEKPSKFVRLYSNFAETPDDKKNDPLYWYDSYKSGLPLFEGKSTLTPSAKNENVTGEIIDWERPRSTRIDIRTKVNAPTLLTISESWFPGWQVFVDGKKENLVRANYALMGIILSAGKHHTSFIYQQPWYYPVGKFISIFSLLLVIIITEHIKIKS